MAVYCCNCRNLLLVKKKTTIALCIGASQWIDGSLRPRIDITGLSDPELRNHGNDCGLYAWFPCWDTYRKKKFMIAKLRAELGKYSDLPQPTKQIDDEECDDHKEGYEEGYAEEAFEEAGDSISTGSGEATDDGGTEDQTIQAD